MIIRYGLFLLREHRVEFSFSMFFRDLNVSSLGVFNTCFSKTSKSIFRVKVVLVDNTGGFSSIDHQIFSLFCQGLEFPLSFLKVNV